MFRDAFRLPRTTLLILASILALIVANLGDYVTAPAVNAAVGAYTRWTAKTSMPTVRFGVAAAASSGKVYAIGGESLSFVIHDQVERYDPTTDSWTSATPLSSARTEVAATTGIDGKIYAIGGNLDGGQTGFRTVTTLEVYDPVSDTWTIQTPMSVNRSFLFAATATNGKIYAMGGIQTNNQEPVFTVEEYNPITDAWITKTDMPVNRYGASAVAASNGKIYVFGGQNLNGGHFATVLEYDPGSRPVKWCKSASSC